MFAVYLARLSTDLGKVNRNHFLLLMEATDAAVIGIDVDLSLGLL